MSYQQLTLDERYQIQALHQQGCDAAAIAREIGRHRSTITRELARNSVSTETGVPYTAQRAQKLTATRRIEKGREQRLIQGELQSLVETKLHLGWSPEQVSGRLRLEKSIRLSHETIYQHVLRDAEMNGFLRYCLRFGGYKHHRFRKSSHARRKQRQKHISQRPAAANERSEIGHWERDCIVGKQGGAALLTMVDRKTRFSRIRVVAKTADVATATVDALRSFTVKTITNDNGIEFQRDAELSHRLDVPIYFCDPSSPWQRGSIENLNGLIRNFVRKGTAVENLHPNLPRALEDTLNHRPRKTLGFRTPHEALFETRTELMQGQLMRLGLEFSGLT